MVIDKSFGVWDNNSDYIDDITYYLYVEYCVSKTNYNILPQSVVYSILHMKISNLQTSSINFIQGFYEDAKLILRREKIQKILNRKL